MRQGHIPEPVYGTTRTHGGKKSPSGMVIPTTRAFYEDMADSIRQLRSNQSKLISMLIKSSRELKLQGHREIPLQDEFKNPNTGQITTGTLKNICPFTVIASFNRQKKLDGKNRNLSAKELANQLNVIPPKKIDFLGIPHFQRSKWFFMYDRKRKGSDIGYLWDAFEAAIDHDRHQSLTSEARFINAFNDAHSVENVGEGSLTIGLFWIRPGFYPPLDKSSREYMETYFKKKISLKNKKISPAESYLKLINDLKSHMKSGHFPVTNIPELALEAYN